MACPRFVSNFCGPKLLWYQTDLTVVIRILLVDVLDYYLRVESDHLLFSTVTNGRKYYLTLYLFGVVIAEKTVHKNVGREIRIYLTKGFKWFPWLRLILSKEKNPLVSYDLEYIHKQNDVKANSFGETVKEYKRRKHIQYIMPVVPSSDEEESDEDLIDYTAFA